MNRAIGVIAVAASSVTSLAACSSRTVETVSSGAVASVSVDALTRGWPAKSREAATSMAQKYGQPAEQTPTMLVWHNTGPWKRTIVYREEIPHSFPKPHTDLLEQFIDYRVPVEFFDELAAYDGSVIIERTKGEMSARCDKEEMNFLALNLANDIVNGRRTVQQARDEYARQAMAFMNKQPAPYTERLQFAVPRGGTGDPDRPAMSGM
ncbi:MAG: hypothetical protein ACT4PJ_13780 [Gemmatimonadaceae bacterium]